MNTELVKVEPMAVAMHNHSDLSLPAIVDRILTGEITNEKLSMIKELVAMDAERKFTVGFVALQADTPSIVAKTVIPNRGKYERFEDVMEVVGPLLQRHGFSVSFSNEFQDNRIIETCHLMHVGGHTKSNKFAVRVGKADTETQADCKAATTAKRNALLNALNIVIRQDCLNEEDDAGIEGDPNAKVTREQADELERRAQLTNSNIPAFLKYAKAERFADIQASRYAEMDALLARKEKGGR